MSHVHSFAHLCHLMLLLFILFVLIYAGCEDSHVIELANTVRKILSDLETGWYDKQGDFMSDKMLARHLKIYQNSVLDYFRCFMWFISDKKYEVLVISNSDNIYIINGFRSKSCWIAVFHVKIEFIFDIFVWAFGKTNALEH